MDFFVIRMKAPSHDLAPDQPGQGLDSFVIPTEAPSDDLAPDETGQNLELEAKIDDTAHILLTQEVATTVLSTFFSRRDVYDGVSAMSPLTFAPGLASVLSAPEPPNPEFFLSLPHVDSLDDKVWAIYAIVLERLMPSRSRPQAVWPDEEAATAAFLWPPPFLLPLCSVKTAKGL